MTSVTSLTSMNSLSIPIETTTFPTLYNLSKNGKTKEWKIRVESYIQNAKIITSFGYIDSKTIETTRVISSGKNSGKINETTPYTQALAEATSKWKRKKETEFFVENRDLKMEDKERMNIPLPMLAQDYTKHSAKIKFPCYIQPKLDGYRCLHTLGTAILWSRQSKQFLNCDHILDELSKLNQKITKDCITMKDLVLDGELYNHLGKFEDFGVLRKKTLRGDDHQKIRHIKYWIYDIVDDNLSFKDRLDVLKKLGDTIRELQLQNICVLDTYEVSKRDDIKEYHLKIVELDYEGTIIRNRDGKYTQKYRSYDLQKYKDFRDEEFQIVDFSKEQGDLIVFVCETKNGHRFNVQCKGTKEDRHEVYLDTQRSPERYLGKALWVQFFEYTADGVPRFPKSYRSVKESIRYETN